MEAFLIRALSKIGEELKAGSSSKSSKKLVEACDEALGALKDTAADQNASKYFGLIRQTCESQNVGATIVALDCTQKLIAHGFLKGDELVENPNNEKSKEGESVTLVPLIDVIIETICSCNDFADDGVQLQVIKALLTAITTDHCEVNEGSLLRAVRSCYNIHLVSHSIVNRTTAKATLTQVLSYVFQRMESTDENIKDKVDLEVKTKENVETITAAAAEDSESDTRAAEEKTEKVDTVEEEAIATIAPDIKATTELSLAVVGELAENMSNESDDVALDGGGGEWASIDHKNSWLLFRALCKLSMKDSLNRANTGSTSSSEVPVTVYDPIAVQSKALSLELLLWVLKYSGPCFRNNPRFINSVRSYLCVSLLRNCTSAVPEIVGLSLQVFVQLHTHFNHHLKAEVEVFITKIFLPILDSENSTPYHKELVLNVLFTMCADAATINDIFRNYDADFESADLFKQMVDSLARCAKGGFQVNPFDSYGVRRISPLELKIRSTALKGLDAILKSLILLDKPILGDQVTSVSSEGIIQESSNTEVVDPEKSVVDSPLSADSLTTPKSPNNVVQTRAASAPSALSPSDAVNAFDRKQKYREEQQMGILQFNLKPSKGLKYLEDRGHFKHEPFDVAKFLHANKNTLDKTVIGDYLGKEKQYQDGFCVKVLHEYIDQMDFKDMSFDDSIRHFLSGFRLPGEAQKIDRMMEKFAERYTIQNSEVFPSADTAFVLAFSIIMLNTDLHNPAIADDRRMTKQGFRRQAEGIASGGDLPVEMLDSIYDRIKASAISLKDDDHLRQKVVEQPESALGVMFGSVPVEKRRQQAFIQEREDMVKSSESLFQTHRRLKNKNNKGSNILMNSGQDESLGVWVRPMFEVCWGPIVGTLNHTLESSTTSTVETSGNHQTDDLELIQLGLGTMCNAIHLAATLGIETARSTLVGSLAKFTTLDAVREMKPRHVECIKALLKVAVDDGNFLGESWEPILQCVSRLNRLHDAAQGSLDDESFFSNGARNTTVAAPPTTHLPRNSQGHSSSSFSDGFAKMFSSTSPAPLTIEATRALEESNARNLMEAVDSLSDKIDHIFENSVKLDSQGIVHFVTQLSAVAHLELHSSGTKSLRGWETQAQADSIDVASTTPRVFSLQKLVEVAAFNMDIRPRLIWSNVWGVLSKLFTSAGLHPNPKVAMYAIDSLRQLSVKFLTKDELRDFNFQRLFLRPFESIMRESKSSDVCELIVMSVDSMMQARLHQLRSGWKTMFAVLGLATTGGMRHNAHISALGFACLQRLTMEHFDLLVLDFTELVNALLTFAASPDTPTAQVALALVHTCAEQLGSGAVAKSMSRDLKQGQLPTLNGRGYAIDDNKWQLWWPLLYGVSQLVGDPRFAIREAALEVLGNTLVAYGGSFSEETWRLVFKGVIFPIMESAWTDSTKEASVSSLCPAHNPNIPFSEASFITSTSHLVFKVCTDLLVEFPHVADTLLHETLSLLTESICQEIETLSRIAARALHFLIMRMPPNAPPALWDMLCEGLSAIACRPLPKQLQSIDLSSPLTASKSMEDARRKENGEEQEEDGQGQQDNGDDVEPGIENAMVRRSIMTQLVVTLAIQEAIATVLEAFYLDLSTAQLRILLDAILSTATCAHQFHGDVSIRKTLRSIQFMKFSNDLTSNEISLPHLLEQESRAYGLLLDTLGRLLTCADNNDMKENNRLLIHSENMQSPNLNIQFMDKQHGKKSLFSERLWLPKVRSHGTLYETSSSSMKSANNENSNEGNSENTAKISQNKQRVFAYVLTDDEYEYCFDKHVMERLDGKRMMNVSTQDVLYVDWPGGCEVNVMSGSDFKNKYKKCDLINQSSNNDASPSSSLGIFAANRLTFIFQLVLNEFAKKDERCTMAQNNESEHVDIVSSFQNEVAYLTPMVNQVMQTLSESDATYLKANMGWIMPSLCELIRSNDEEVRVALHQIMTLKLCPLLMVPTANEQSL